MSAEPEVKSDQQVPASEGRGQPALGASEGVEDKLPIGAIAQIDYDKSLLFFGIVPLLAVGVLALVYAALYFYRRGRSWNELGQAMREDNSNHNQ